MLFSELANNLVKHLKSWAKTCSLQAEIIHDHEMKVYAILDKAKPPHRKHKRRKLGGGHLYDRSSV
jgi:hypothetical protein